MRRHRTDNNQEEIVGLLRKVGASVAITSNIGHGFTDTVVGFRGNTYLIEIKHGKNWTYTDAQVDFRRDWKGGPIDTIGSLEDVVAWVKRRSRVPATV